LKNVVVGWYGEIFLKFLKEKFIKSTRIKAHLYFNFVPIKHRNFDKHKKIISKRLLKIRSNFDPSKVHNYHLVKVSQKKISHLTLSFHSSTHSWFLFFECNSI